MHAYYFVTLNNVKMLHETIAFDVEIPFLKTEKDNDQTCSKGCAIYGSVTPKNLEHDLLILGFFSEQTMLKSRKSKIHG